MVTSAVLSIVSSIIGGGLVLAGQFVVNRAEGKRIWLIRLQEAASDLATSYLQEAATANDRRRAGTHEQDGDGHLRGRPAEGARSFPDTSVEQRFQVHRQAMGRGIEGVWRAWDESDDQFQLAYKVPVGSVRVHGRGGRTDPPGRLLPMSADDLNQPHCPPMPWMERAAVGRASSEPLCRPAGRPGRR